jgi:hypothetical protein
MRPYLAALTLTAIANALAVARFTVLRVARAAPLLTAYLGFLLIFNTLAALVPPNSFYYERIYQIGEPVTVLMAILVVREQYRHAFAEYPGIASLTRWSAYFALALAVALCVLMVYYTGFRIDGGFFTGYVVIWERCVCFTLAVFIGLMIYLVSHYPIKITRNLAINIAIFTVYFCGIFVLSFPSASRNLRAEWFAFYATEVLSILSYLAWGFLLRVDSGEPSVTLRRNIDSREAEHLLGQLDALNRALARSASPVKMKK